MYHNIKLIASVLSILALCACSDEHDAPAISAVWSNSHSQENHRIDCAYPGQIIRLEGSALGDLRKLFVNGTEIDIVSNDIYNTPTSVTFQIPSDVRLSTSHDEVGYIRLITAYGEAVHRPFLVLPNKEKPAISRFSTTVLEPDGRLTVTGSNLSGARKAWLPTVYGGKVEALVDVEAENTDKQVVLLIPDATFAQGCAEIEMAKNHDGFEYTERVYSATTDFSN